ncbi:HK97 gp10 family phage protein [Sphingobium sp. BHU LFT2]|uniref:HK97-gp10 family putative phage morphogenesis protein n=1 Tax=Sphingobium sp. BHU LFT2 TaxID=2807634 RepID=UPI001BE6A6A2|nr:HK97-gp10 family putative phage morphogenesis protein [Sphingobium sp. BHU LFT2]MBT2242683.1 HK97 gp10 family phage protein [Sphingobium sp. BHU LFT2]
MATMRGRNEVSAFLSSLPENLAAKVLRGAGRAGGRIIADEAKDRSPSEEVAREIVVKTKREDSRIVVHVTVKPGYAWFRALWLERGTSGHFISVDDSQRSGRGIGRINQQVRDAQGDASLVINDNFVGRTIWHPGANPHPFLRPALDIKEEDAIRAAQSYINSRISRRGITGTEEGDDE